MIRMGARSSGKTPETYARRLNLERFFEPVGARERGVGVEPVQPRLLVAAGYYDGWKRLARPLAGSQADKEAYLDEVCDCFTRAGQAARRRSQQLDVYLAAAGKLSKGEERKDKKCLFKQILAAFERAPEEEEVREAFINYVDFVWSNARDLDPVRKAAYARQVLEADAQVARRLKIDEPDASSFSIETGTLEDE
jgi:hypothetical protein